MRSRMLVLMMQDDRRPAAIVGPSAHIVGVPASPLGVNYSEVPIAREGCIKSLVRFYTAWQKANQQLNGTPQ